MRLSPAGRLAGTAGVLALAGVLAGCSGGSTPDKQKVALTPAPAPTVRLDVLARVSDPVTIGVVVTSRAGAEGAEYAALAAGARVAEFRLDAPGKDRVRLEVVDDQGTAAGATAAVKKLVADHVAGIVYASAGAHLAAGLAAADGTAVLLPYDAGTAAGPTAFRTGPTGDEIASAVRDVLTAQNRKRPLVLAADGGVDALRGLGGGELVVPVQAGAGLDGEVATAVSALTKRSADAVVVSAPATLAADVVSSLQGKAGDIAVVLGPSALAPAFAQRLAALGTTGAATTSGQFTTVGETVDEVAPDQSMAGFLGAVRLAAQSSSVMSLGAGSASGTSAGGDQTFARQGAATADTRSHDAVLALAAAVAKAGSVDPSAVLSALKGLTVTAADGLAGPDLAFTGADALAAKDVAALQATTRGPGRGVEQPAPALTWFPLPANAG